MKNEREKNKTIEIGTKIKIQILLRPNFELILSDKYPNIGVAVICARDP